MPDHTRETLTRILDLGLGQKELTKIYDYMIANSMFANQLDCNAFVKLAEEKSARSAICVVNVNSFVSLCELILLCDEFNQRQSLHLNLAMAITKLVTDYRKFKTYPMLEKEINQLKVTCKQVLQDHDEIDALIDSLYSYRCNMYVLIKEAAHVLALPNWSEAEFIDDFNEKYQFNGWDTESAIQSTQNRYRIHAGVDEDITIYDIDKITKEDFSHKVSLLQHGQHFVLVAGWYAHNISLQILQDKNVTHFVYVNRGRRADDKTSNTVYAFTCNNSVRTNFSEYIYQAFSPKNREEAARFLSKHMNSAEYNPGLSGALTKSKQKTGNCTIAGLNISWHFHMTSTRMQNTDESFIGAYIHEKPGYKALRALDRGRAIGLLFFAKTTFKNEGIFFDTLTYVLNKLHKKLLKSSGTDVQLGQHVILSRIDLDLLKEFAQIVGEKKFVHRCYLQHPEIDDERLGLLAQMEVLNSQSKDLFSSNELLSSYYQESRRMLASVDSMLETWSSHISSTIALVEGTSALNVNISMDKGPYDSMFTAFCEYLKMTHNLTNELDTRIEGLLIPELPLKTPGSESFLGEEFSNCCARFMGWNTTTSSEVNNGDGDNLTTDLLPSTLSR